MAASTDLNSARKDLAEALGDNMKIYHQILKSWFKQQVSKEDFDHEARKLMTAESVHLHNQFLLAILTRCQKLGSSFVRRDSSSRTSPSVSKVPKKQTSKRKSQQLKVSFQQRFIPRDALTQAPQIPCHIPNPDERGPGYVSREMALPDIGLIHGRMIVTAWDFGLDDVDEHAVQMLLIAVEIQLKNILTATFGRRNAFRLREKKFRFSMGTQHPNTHLRNIHLVRDSAEESEATGLTAKGLQAPSVKPSVEAGRQEGAIHLASAGAMVPTKQSVTLFDLLEALQVHKSALPSHAVYATNVERIINRMCHPSNEELLQEDIHRQEVQIKQELYAQQAAMRTKDKQLAGRWRP